MALSEAQVNHAKQMKKIEKLQNKLAQDPDDNLLNAKPEIIASVVSLSNL